MIRLRRWGAAVLGLALAASLASCVSLPEEGPVVETQPTGEVEASQAAAIDAVPPEEGDTRLDIVNGFLEAMTAYPVRTNVARQFLTEEAQPSWKPDEATITYAEVSSTDDGDEVSVSLTDPELLDAQGGWQGPLPREQRELSFPMVIEDGEYRIAAAPNALIVPAQWFAQRFRQVSLYFFDRTAQILVPEPVFVPRGVQLATTLIEGLIAGPGDDLDGVARTFLPPDLKVGLSVPVSDGVADISLVGEPIQQNPDVVDKILAQLTLTLRQESSIEAIRLTIGDEQIRLPAGAAQYGVDNATEYDPTGHQASQRLYGLSKGLLVTGDADSLSPADGPLATADYDLRSVAVNLLATQAAGVSLDGRSVLVAPVRTETGEEAGERVDEVVSGATNLLPPAWDFSERLWLVDRTAAGARLFFREQGELRNLRVRGLTGRDVRSFLVSRDATRFVAVVRRQGVDRLVLGRIEVNFQGRVRRAVEVQRISIEDGEALRVSDIAWTSTTSIALLSQIVPGELFEIRTVAVDGAPAGTEALSTTVSESVTGLVGSPVEQLPQYAVTRDSLVDLATGGVTSLEARPVSLRYVG